MDEILSDTVCEPNQLKDYFNKLLPPILGAETCDLENSLWSNETTEKLKQFINNPKVKAIYFTKKREDRKDEGKKSFHNKQVYRLTSLS